MLTQENKDRLREIVDEQLRLYDSARKGSPCTPNFFNSIRSVAENEGLQFDEGYVVQYWWSLARLGVISLLGGTNTSGYPDFDISDNGKSVLESRVGSPHDREGFLQHLRDDAWSTLDPVFFNYVDEAVQAWQAGLFRSCLVMIGCCHEQLVWALADAVSKSGRIPWSDKLKKMLSAPPTKPPPQISVVFEECFEALKDLRGNKLLSAGVSDALDRRLSSIFDYSRGLRNQSGHLSKAAVSYSEAQAALLLLPSSLRLVGEILDELSTLASSQSSGGS